MKVALPKVAAVVVHYRDPGDTLEAVASLKATHYNPLDLIVVDNAADDRLAEELAKRHPSAQLIRNEENLGFAGGCNVGIQHGLGRGADYVLLFNNDAVATPALLEELVQLGETEPGIGIAGPTILFDDRTRVWYRGGTLHPLLGYTRHPGMGSTVLTEDGGPISTDFATGCAMFVRREVFERVGLLDDSLFLYMEDLEFCERAKKANFRVVYHPAAVARHRVSASAGVRGSNALTPLQAYYVARNMVLFIRKHWHGPRRWTALQAQIFAQAPYRILPMLLRRRWGSLRTYLEGLWDGFLGVTGRWGDHDRWGP